MKKQHQFHVGQILYYVPKGAIKIVPCQIVEELAKKTLNGNEVVYKLKLGKSDEIKDVNDLQGEIYEDINTLKKVLIDNVTNFVNSISNAAYKSSQEWYKVVSSPKNATEQITQNKIEQQNLNEQYEIVNINGVNTKVNLSNVPEEYREEYLQNLKGE